MQNITKTMAIPYNRCEKERNKVVLTGLFAIVLTVICFAFLRTGYANAMRDTFESMCDEVRGNLAETISGMFFSTDADGNVTSVDFVGTMQGTGDSILAILKGVGAGIVAILIYFDIIHAVQRGQDCMDMWLKIFIKMAVTCLTIAYLDEILQFLDDLGSYIGSLVMGGIASNDESGNAFEAKDLMYAMVGDESPGTWKSLGGIFKIFLPWCIQKLVVLAAKVASYSILVEMAIRRAFMPIAVAEIAGEGMRSPGIRYLKKYLALYIRIAIMMVIAYAGGQLFAAAAVAAESGPNMEVVWSMIAANMACVTLMGMTGNFANDIVGV